MFEWIFNVIIVVILVPALIFVGIGLKMVMILIGELWNGDGKRKEHENGS